MSRFPETRDRSKTLSPLSVVALVVLSLLWWARLSGMSLLERLTGWAAATTRWSELPWPLGLLTILTYRNRLRRENLYDTESQTQKSVPAPEGTRHLTPRTVSRELLTRETFLPASTLNLLAASWIQFMIRDWVSHGKSPKSNPWKVPLADDDSWPENPMRILRTRDDPTRTSEEEGMPPTHINVNTHWWDGSQIYGSDETTQARVRSGEDGKLNIGPDGLIPVDPNSKKHPADEPGFWIGLVMMHTLFTREHNAICDKLRAEYPSWSDDDLFAHARLINTALLAKIHTTEWRPALLDHPTARRGLNANWWGLAGKTVKRLVGRISDN